MPAGERPGGPAEAVRATIARAFAETIRLHERVAAMDPAPLLAAADLLLSAFERGGKLLAFGNGGSAADAQHLVTELVARYTRVRRALPAVTLTADASLMTAVANDFGYEQVFARQVAALGRPGDVAVGITTSGRSANVLRGLEAARAGGLSTVALTGGDGGPAAALADVHVNVPDPSTPRVQEVHRTLLHVLCELIEQKL